METAEVETEVGQGLETKSEAESLGRDPGRTIEYILAETSLGTALVGVTESGVCAVLLGDDRNTVEADLAARFRGRVLREADEPGMWARRVLSCVDGRVPDPGDIPLDLKGTAFQRAVWARLRAVPSGTTVTYSAIATGIGRPSSVRAVARACGANPVAIVVPCHRVLRGDGSISGYRWGVERKRMLLDRERAGAV